MSDKRYYFFSYMVIEGKGFSMGSDFCEVGITDANKKGYFPIAIAAKSLIGEGTILDYKEVTRDEYYFQRKLSADVSEDSATESV